MWRKRWVCFPDCLWVSRGGARSSLTPGYRLYPLRGSEGEEGGFTRRGGRLRSAAQRTERTTLLAQARCAACVNALWFCGKQLNTEGRERRCWWARCVKKVLGLLSGLHVAFQGWRSLRDLRPWLPAVIPSGDRGNETRCFRWRGGRLRSAAQRTVRTTLLAHVRVIYVTSRLWGM